MALPRTRQNLANFLSSRNISHAEFAKIIESKPARVNQLICGCTYPTAREIRLIEQFFELPIQVFFDAEMLRYYVELDSRYNGVRSGFGQ